MDHFERYITSVIAIGLNTPVKLELAVKVKLTLEQATKAQSGGTGIALLFL
jgi:hypothetical protein